MAKIMIGIKVSPELKKLLQETARDENRSLSNFIKHCILTYLKEKKGIKYKEGD
jgi:predicted transcriptional regulator